MAAFRFNHSPTESFADPFFALITLKAERDFLLGPVDIDQPEILLGDKFSHAAIIGFTRSVALCAAEGKVERRAGQLPNCLVRPSGRMSIDTPACRSPDSSTMPLSSRSASTR